MAVSSGDVSKDVKECINDIILKYHVNGASDVTYHPRSTAGDGFLSRSHVITANIENGDRCELFVKEPLHITNSRVLRLEECFANEIHFYDKIYPAYSKFAFEKTAKNSLTYVPKCYGTSSTNNIIALENLRVKGFELFDCKKLMNDQHIELVLKTIAKLHATSFAFKDQKRKEYETLTEKTSNIMECQTSDNLGVTRKGWVDEFIASLDPVKDEDLLLKLDNLGDRLNCYFRESVALKSEYSILIHGDCWSNNIMFLYENQNTQNPVDIKLIDWQMIRCTIPVFDLAFFFYTVASDVTLGKLDYFLKMYHEEFSTNMKILGSDPNTIYPYSVLEKQWKEHGKYGFVMAFLTLTLMTLDKDKELFNFEKFDLERPETWYAPKKTNEYFRRLKTLAEHLIVNDFL